MADAPNTSPAFIQTMGIIGVPVDLTNQVCTADNPGTTPIIAYDPTADYAQGNGALIEHIDIQLTGNTAATTVLLFYKFISDTTPKWRKAAQRAIASATVSTTAELPSYSMPLKNILFPVPQAGAGTGLQQFQGLRINSPDRSIQWGFALTVAAGTSPIIVTMYGGEY
ncbi:hypothetical protein G7B40_001470 [Aetokthonos hydrillicola Thurmond2011]|jgi:hypothetical protein|uniref:Uncharacterized protein n=1 Tax=Aetokthonos hydrillicola Thurmond2011 TaxID=2712845 RepID=A0AAP5M5K4_9CYAN|nr:hypothetical protein [Aetokthonos hydrillicola]MBO3463134.1 hypothetical protein [Aetokthonos hydrillicola CCALA 1050]MBW4591082.1 hypothetical protein [Aetokthonos hydrillicola CCALA 1050]MDR9893255.1 hypothetical protein [Aetokthonos hydrillicola Thurmond2011]